MSRFEQILKELTPLVHASLHVNAKGLCQLLVNKTHHVQLSLDKTGENLLIASFIGEVVAGKFREEILKKALKANTPYPRDGILAYCDKTNQLTLFFLLSLEHTSGATLYEFLKGFAPKIDHWKKQLAHG